jgi:hypothetical protein
MTRRGRVAFAVGGLLTGGTAAYLGVKYGYSVGSGSSAHVAANLPIGSSGTGHSLIAHAHEAKVGNHHSAHSVHNHSKTQQTTSPDSPGKHFPTTAILKRGKNPWDIALRQLHLHGYLHPTDAQIQSYDMHMLHQTYPGLTEDELLEKARHLGVGTRLKLPRIRAR